MNPEKVFVPNVTVLRKRLLLSRSMLKQDIAFGQQISPGVNVERTLLKK